MEDLAIVYVGYSKYSFLWDPWLSYYDTNFGYHSELSEYMISDTVFSHLPFFHHIQIKAVGAKEWTKEIRSGIKRIPRDNIFFILDDIFFVKPLYTIFMELYRCFLEEDMDSLRIRMKSSAATADSTDIIIDGHPIRKLRKNSKYLISYIPNIFKKDVLLDFLSVDESPWDSEIKGTERIREKGYKIYDYFYPGWYVNTMIKGKLTDKGNKLIDATK